MDSQLLTDWIGEQARLKKLSASYRGILFPGKDLTCKGKVTKKYLEGLDHCIECEVWVEDFEGKTTTPGTATVVLPSQV